VAIPFMGFVIGEQAGMLAPRYRTLKGRDMAHSVFQAAHAVVAALIFSASAASAQPSAAVQPVKQHTANGLLARQSDGSLRPVTFDPSKAPFAFRNNNWVGMKGPNLKHRWPGQTGATPLGFALFDDPAYGISSFIALMRSYQEHDHARSAVDILKRYSPAGDCSGAPSLPPSKRRIGGGCMENQTTPPVTAMQVAHAVELQPTDDLDLFGPGGRINHPDRLRVLIDAIVSQEVGVDHCPQPPRGENWIGCRVDDGLYNRAVELMGRRG